MESISIKILNEVLGEKTRGKYFLYKQEGRFGIPDDGEGNPGDYNETFRFYRHPEMPENVFLQITYQTDSYGENEGITEMKFVEGKAKTITVYEPIK